MPLDRQFLISPPFGNYYRHAKAYSVLGSFTQFPRPGRFWQIARTVRGLGYTPQGRPKGWLNKVELRNPGIMSVAKPIWEPHQICSIAIIKGDADEWDWLADFLTHGESIYIRGVEINVSCPNTNEPFPALPADAVLRKIIEHNYRDIIWKLPPLVSATNAAMRLADQGAKYIHLSNTFPTPAGGFSGPILLPINLPIVEATCTALYRGKYNTEVIAGGGIYSINDVFAYQNAGPKRFAISSAYFKPGRASRILNS